MIVAKIDRSEKREIPQIPCPLVQPLLTLVPTPTKNPPMIRVGIFSVIEKGISLFEKKNTIKDPKLTQLKIKYYQAFYHLSK